MGRSKDVRWIGQILSMSSQCAIHKQPYTLCFSTHSDAKTVTCTDSMEILMHKYKSSTHTHTHKHTHTHTHTEYCVPHWTRPVYFVVLYSKCILWGRSVVMNGGVCSGVWRPAENLSLSNNGSHADEDLDELSPLFEICKLCFPKFGLSYPPHHHHTHTHVRSVSSLFPPLLESNTQACISSYCIITQCVHSKLFVQSLT